MEQNLKILSGIHPHMQTHKPRRQNESNKWMSKLLPNFYAIAKKKTLQKKCSGYSTDWFYFALLRKVYVAFN